MYAPHDLSAVEMAKWKKRDKPNHDVFDVLDFNPLEHYRVCSTPHLHLSQFQKRKRKANLSGG